MRAVSETARPPGSPVAPGERIESLDVVRGFAVLGILLVNILAFGLPFRAYFDPTTDGAVQGIDFAAFVTTDLLAEGVMRALFSMLFGAGVAMLAAGPRPKPAGVYFRRQLLLLAFGVFDGLVLLWTGDILALYALAGLILYFLRNWRPRALFIAAGFVFAYLAMLYAAMFFALTVLPEQAAAVQARLNAGEAASVAEQALLTEWIELRANFYPPDAALANEAVKFQGTWPEAFLANAAELWLLFTQAYPLFLFWDAAACMLLGMALYKNGTLQGRRSPRFYARLAAIGCATGLAVNGFETSMRTASGFAVQWVSGASTVTHDLGRVALALGMAAGVTIICQRGWLTRTRRALAATGRMALTNYILQSVLGLAIFHSFGLGLWNELPRHQLYLVVLGEWALMLAFSAWWLQRFRFGPLEWLWRSLTYGRKQPARSA